MFLVGMCDIFLLLYLTALAQVDARQLSDITVKDYVKLKESAAATEADLKSRERSAQDTLRSFEEAKRELDRITAEHQKLVQESRRKASAEADLWKRKEEALRAAAKEKEQLARNLEHRNKEAEAEAARLAAMAKSSQEAEAEHRKAAEEANRRAAEAAQAAARAEKEAREAKLKAEEAGRREHAAVKTAELARKSESEALVNAVNARIDAEESAERAERRIRIADQEISETRERISSITQSAGAAYQRNIQSRAVPLRVTIGRKRLMGDGTETFNFTGIPVKMGDERVVFIPVGQLALESARDADDVAKLSMESAGAIIRKIYVRGVSPDIVGAVLPGPGPAAESIGSGGIHDFMPTLIAFRNGSRMGWGDRIRDLNRDYFLFQRDRLERDATGFSYRTKGFRGTGDFAEYLLKGDQIVDLDGNFLGLVTSENTIVTIRNLQNWKAIDLEADKPADAARKIAGG